MFSKTQIALPRLRTIFARIIAVTPVLDQQNARGTWWIK